ncbi:hypothetical protein TWF694_006341 [Orbilia ellipsospora]|uniref:BTB domain-containing protein n=1 Tax=Orbilia ellipsospora TaxID=2528407 RepID=A0AAV9XKS9_9PEZI
MAETKATGPVIVFRGDRIPPPEAHYQPWEFLKIREPIDITIVIYATADGSNEPKRLGTYPVHKRIISPSPLLLQLIQKNPTTSTIQFFGECPYIFKPVLAYMYLHDFKYLCHTSSYYNIISKPESLLEHNKLTIHDKVFHPRMTYYIDLYYLAKRLKLDQLCSLLVERLIAVHDVPTAVSAPENCSQHPRYRYNPFTLYNMPDVVKEWYIQRVYGRSVPKMVIGKKDNLRWRVVEGIISKGEMIEMFEYQLKHRENFFNDVFEGIKHVCARMSAGELENSPLRRQYLELKDWKERTKEEGNLNSKAKWEVAARISDQIGRLSFSAEDRQENKVNADLEAEDDEEEL